MAETYNLKVTVKTYKTAADALADINAQTILKPGTYYIWAKEGKASQLGNSNVHDPVDNWVNTMDNVVTPPTTRLNPPELTTPVENPVGEAPDDANWRGTLNLGYAGLFVFVKDTQVTDLESKYPPKEAKNGDYLQISGKFTGPDGNEYARPKNKPNVFMWYGIPIESLKPYNEVYGTHTTLEERQVLHTLTRQDKLNLWLAKIKTLGADIWDVVRPKEKR